MHITMGIQQLTCPPGGATAVVDAQRYEITSPSVATGGTHAGVVGWGQAESVSETQTTHAVEIKRVAVGNRAAFASIATR